MPMRRRPLLRASAMPRAGASTACEGIERRAPSAPARSTRCGPIPGEARSAGPADADGPRRRPSGGDLDHGRLGNDGSGALLTVEKARLVPAGADHEAVGGDGLARGVGGLEHRFGPALRRQVQEGRPTGATDPLALDLGDEVAVDLGDRLVAPVLQRQRDRASSHRGAPSPSGRGSSLHPASGRPPARPLPATPPPRGRRSPPCGPARRGAKRRPPSRGARRESPLVLGVLLALDGLMAVLGEPDLPLARDAGVSPRHTALGPQVAAQHPEHPGLARDAGSHPAPGPGQRAHRLLLCRRGPVRVGVDQPAQLDPRGRVDRLGVRLRRHLEERHAAGVPRHRLERRRRERQGGHVGRHEVPVGVEGLDLRPPRRGPPHRHRLVRPRRPAAAPPSRRAGASRPALRAAAGLDPGPRRAAPRPGRAGTPSDPARARSARRRSRGSRGWRSGRSSAARPAAPGARRAPPAPPRARPARGTPPGRPRRPPSSPGSADGRSSGRTRAPRRAPPPRRDSDPRAARRRPSGPPDRAGWTLRRAPLLPGSAEPSPRARRRPAARRRGPAARAARPSPGLDGRRRRDARPAARGLAAKRRGMGPGWGRDGASSSSRPPAGGPRAGPGGRRALRGGVGLRREPLAGRDQS